MMFFTSTRTVQEEVAQENQQKMEAEKQSVEAAKAELDKHQKMAEEADAKYSSVRDQIDQLSEEMEQLKVKNKKKFQKLKEKWFLCCVVTCSLVTFTPLLSCTSACFQSACIVLLLKPPAVLIADLLLSVILMKDEQLKLDAECAKHERNLKVMENKVKSHEDNIQTMKADLSEREDELQVTSFSVFSSRLF